MLPSLKPLEQELLAKVNAIVDLETKRTLGELNTIVDVSTLDDGTFQIVFSPSSPVSPIAYDTARRIRDVAEAVPGVSRVRVVCQGHMMDELVNRLVNREQKT